MTLKQEIIIEFQKLTNIKDIILTKAPIHTGANFATNAALKTGINADEIIKKLKKSKYFSKIESKNGFINLYIKQEELIKHFQNFLSIKNLKFKKLEPLTNSNFTPFRKNLLRTLFFKSLNLKNKSSKINIEFLSSNPTGLPQLGNGRNGFWGDALSNILEASGQKITREFYLNNAKESRQIESLGLTVLGKEKTYSSPYLKQKIKELKKGKILNEAVFKKEPGEIGRIMADAIFSDMKILFEKINIKFDNFFNEDELYSSGIIKQMLEILQDKNLVYMKDGALWLKLKELGHNQDEVIVRSNGNPTYLMADIAYHKNKFERGFDKLIVILGADHHSHASRLKAIAKLFDYKNPFDILITQLVRVKKEDKISKMSKRLGTAVSLETVINEVGTDATRFMLLSQSIDSHMVFDAELLKKKNKDNPVYYIQYAYVRILGILEKFSIKSQFSNFKLETKILNKEELNLIKKVLELPDIVLEISKNYRVNLLAEYLLELAKLFHNYYDKYRVIDEKNIKTTQSRLIIISGVKLALEYGFKLLGINTPEKM